MASGTGEPKLFLWDHAGYVLAASLVTAHMYCLHVRAGSVLKTKNNRRGRRRRRQRPISRLHDHTILLLFLRIPPTLHPYQTDQPSTTQVHFPLSSRSSSLSPYSFLACNETRNTDETAPSSQPVSSYAQKVRIALRHKGIPFDKETPGGLGSGHPAATSQPFSATNPRIEVPVLIDGDLKIFDSTIILEYLEDKYPTTPALLPATPALRAKARMIEDVCDSQYEALNWALAELDWFKRGEPFPGLEAKLKEQARHQTAQLQEWLTGQLGGGRWFNGPEFGWADLCVAPMVNRSVVYGFGPEEGTALREWHGRVMEVPAVKETFGEFATGVTGMGGAAERVRTGKMRREYRDHRLEWMVKSGGIEIVNKGLRDGNVRFNWPDPLVEDKGAKI